MAYRLRWPFRQKIVSAGSPAGGVRLGAAVALVGALAVPAFIAAAPTSSAATAPAPAVTAVIADSGSAAGGQRVTVIGTDLFGAATVDFGPTSAIISASTATTVTVTSPAGAIGTVDVKVTTPGGTSATSTADDYTYTRAQIAYVTNAGSNNVTPIDVATNTPGTPIIVGGDPQGVAVTPDGKTVYAVGNQSGTVTPITVVGNTPGTPITVGAFPSGVAFTPNSATAYVTNFGGHTVTPITVAGGTAGTRVTGVYRWKWLSSPWRLLYKARSSLRRADISLPVRSGWSRSR